MTHALYSSQLDMHVIVLAVIANKFSGEWLYCTLDIKQPS